ncbi:MAG: arginine--tRNA ligase [bacterium]|nr:arginine--tRNA ligase [bacterium]
MAETRKSLEKSIQKCLQDLGAGDIAFSVEHPENAVHGDYATNAALVSTKALRKPPMDIAEILADRLRRDASVADVFEKIKVEKPGFINFTFLPGFLQSSVSDIIKARDAFGKSAALKGENINVEFISANPTGPLTLANGRGGFFGDALGNILSFAGADVTKEYYVNDAGNQIKTLGESVLASAGMIPAAEHHYQGAYIADYTKEFAGELLAHAHAPEELGRKVAGALLDRHIKPSLKKAGIVFDRWTSEYADLRKKSMVEKSLKDLGKRGFTYQKEGALWLKTSQFGDTEDRVLVRSTGSDVDYTYLAVDIAYHLAKWRRGHTKLINIWGADHHGAVARLNAAMRMTDKSPVDVLLMQLVRLVENGIEVRMSKRTGMFVTLEELLHEVGVDVTRFFFLMREPNSHMDFDLTLAKEYSQKNPVFYVQYAHARLANILKKAVETKMPKGGRRDFGRLKKKDELAVIRKLLQFPELVEDIARSHEVHRLPMYAMDLATVFHKFYDTTRVIGEDWTVSNARLGLVEATKITLGNALKLMGVSAPERM